MEVRSWGGDLELGGGLELGRGPELRWRSGFRWSTELGWRYGVGVEVRSWGGGTELGWRYGVGWRSGVRRCGVMVYGIGFRTWLKLS